MRGMFTPPKSAAVDPVGVLSVLLWHLISAENTHAVCRGLLAVPEVVFRKLLSAGKMGGAAA